MTTSALPLVKNASDGHPAKVGDLADAAAGERIGAAHKTVIGSRLKPTDQGRKTHEPISIQHVITVARPASDSYFSAGCEMAVIRKSWNTGTNRKSRRARSRLTGCRIS
jgi:hypothetical protein